MNYFYSFLAYGNPNPSPTGVCGEWCAGVEPSKTTRCATVLEKGGMWELLLLTSLSVDTNPIPTCLASVV